MLEFSMHKPVKRVYINFPLYVEPKNSLENVHS